MYFLENMAQPLVPAPLKGEREEGVKGEREEGVKGGRVKGRMKEGVKGEGRKRLRGGRKRLREREEGVEGEGGREGGSTHQTASHLSCQRRGNSLLYPPQYPKSIWNEHTS